MLQDATENVEIFARNLIPYISYKQKKVLH